MKQQWKLNLFVLLGFYSGLAVINQAQAFDVNDVLFYASFDESVIPEIHSGKTNEVGDWKKIHFVKGVLGQGILAGDEGALLRYPAVGNIDCREGTVSFWVRNIWVPKGVKEVNHSLLNIPNKLECAYHWWKCMYFFWFDNYSRGLAGYPGPPIRAGDKGEYEWVHMVFTWDKEGNFTSYYDGKQALHLKSGADPGWLLDRNDYIYICDPSLTSGDHNRTEIDELIIFKRPLDSAQVRSLYRRPVSSIKQTITMVPLWEIPVTGNGDNNPSSWGRSFETHNFIENFSGNLCQDALTMKIAGYTDGIYLGMYDQKQLGDREKDYWEIRFQSSRGSDCRLFRYPMSRKSQPATEAVFPWKVDIKAIGDGKYALEAFIPWSSIGLTDKDEDKTFQANMIRGYSGKASGTFSWVDLKRENPYAKLIPVSDIQSVKISQWGNLDNCQLDLVANVKGRSNAVVAEMYLQPSDRREYYDPNTMPGTRSFSGKQLYIKKDFPRGILGIKQNFTDTDINSVILRITDSRDRVVYQSQQQFTPSPPLVSNVKLYPSHRRVEVTASVLKNEHKSQSNLSATICLYDTKDKLLERKHVEKFLTDREVVTFPMAKLPQGKIKVISTLFANNKEIFDTETSFEMQELNPDWIKKPAGIERRVPHVFSPIKVEEMESKITISLWGREYLFDRTLLPVEICSQTRKLLKRPAMLKIFTGGKELKADVAQVKINEKTEDRVSFTINQKIGDYHVTTNNVVEFDGMIWTQMKIVSQKKDATIEKAWLEFPFVPEESTLIHANNCAISTKQFSGETPAEWGSEFTPVVWLGNETVGNCFFIETPVGYNVTRSKKFYEINRNSQETCFRINLVDHTVSMDKPMEISFGWFATPSRPLPENWLAWEYQSIPNVDYSKLAMTRVMTDPCWDESNQFLHQSHPWEWFRKFSRDSKAQGVVGLKYIQPRTISCYGEGDTVHKCQGWYEGFEAKYYETPEKKFWGDEWKISTQDYLCTNTPFRDLICAGLQEIVEKGDIEGIYFDVNGPMACSNSLHPCNQRYDILSQREIRRRLTNIFETHGKRAIIMEHASDNMLGPQMNFATCLLDGEHLSGGVLKNDFREDLPLDRMRVMSSATNWGVVPMIIFYGTPDNLPLADSFMAIWALHMPVHNICRVHDLPKNLLEAFLLDFEFNFDKDTLRFGYWENSQIVQVSPENVKVTIYSKPGKIFLVASNLSDSPATVSLRLDVKTLRLNPEKVQLLNYVPQRSVPPEFRDGILTTSINPNSALMCIIDEKQ